MKTFVASISMIALFVPSTVLAEDLSFGGGVTVTSNYLSDGLSETGNSPAIQPYFELTKNGFYAGVWATNLKDDVGNRAELDLALGYRCEIGAGLVYDLGYTQHFYDKTHAASSELAVSLGVPVSDRLSVSGEVSYDLAEKTFGESLGAEFVLADAWTLHADVGRADPSASVNWGAGVGYALDDRITLDFQVQDTASTSPLVALSVNYPFGDASK
ncbi:TorF family putative porin [Cypionkella sp. TWP1-2-1b2]|uniref:TorF family putative porin n=1 Tax=Cypionkella sp. TWP1-2-1b2 TaxID=2804675 RepID=UPI003CF5B270